jgi:hypothetical protein
MLMDNLTLVNKLNSIAETLKLAIKENESAVNDNQKGYPYAAGYSRSAMQSVLSDVQFLLNHANYK